MSITATFYTFSKKKNSTAIPSGGTSIGINIKDPSSVLNPTILIDRASSPVGFNYVHISSFNRYYYINDWISDHGMWIAQCSVDVLASWRTSILGSSQYVLRSASQINSFIADSSYPMDTQTDMRTTRVGVLHNPFFNTARYILSISNGSTDAKINGVQYLCCDQDQLNAIIYGVLNDQSNYWDSSGTSGVDNSIFRSIVNPLQYIGDAYMLPVAPRDEYLGNVNTLKVGSWTLPYSGSQLKAINNSWMNNALGYIYYNTVTITLPVHPQYVTHGTYMAARPYSQYWLYAGVFGVVALDTSFLTSVNELINTFDINISVKVDMKGNAVLLVTANIPDLGTGVTLAKRYANVAVQIPLTQTKNNSIGWLTGAAQTAANFATGNVMQGIQGSASLISGLESLFPKTETSGVQGSASAIYEDWYIQSEFHKVVCREGQLATNIIGAPLCETVRLDTLSGYCQTAEPWLDIDAYGSEHDQIVNYMTSGFYIV